MSEPNNLPEPSEFVLINYFMIAMIVFSIIGMVMSAIWTFKFAIYLIN